MKEIPLTKGLVALVDDEDYARLSQFKWYAQTNKRINYAVRRGARANGRTPMIWMHREILSAAGLDVDHRDGDGLNNRRANLRLATRRQNICARRPNLGHTYRGVWRAGDRFRAAIKVRGITHHLGTFASETEAARAYDAVAAAVFGAFARLNFAAA